MSLFLFPMPLLSESKKKNCFNTSMRCRIPDGDVFTASSIWYEEETENVIVEYEDNRIFFCLPREEYDAQMKVIIDTGFCDFKKRLVNTTEEKLRKMKQVVPKIIRRENRNKNIAVGLICGFFVSIVVTGFILILSI